jgi:hypothetical protein
MMGEWSTSWIKECENILAKASMVPASSSGTDPFNQMAVAIFESAAIGNSALSDNSVDTPQLASGAVTTNEIEDFSVSESKLQSTSVTQSKIEDGAVTKSKLNATEVIDDIKRLSEAGPYTGAGLIPALSWNSGLPFGSLVQVMLSATIHTNGVNSGAVLSSDEDGTSIAPVALAVNNAADEVTATYGNSDVHSVTGTGIFNIIVSDIGVNFSIEDIQVTYVVLKTAVLL